MGSWKKMLLPPTVYELQTQINCSVNNGLYNWPVDGEEKKIRGAFSMLWVHNLLRYIRSDSDLKLLRPFQGGVLLSEKTSHFPLDANKSFSLSDLKETSVTRKQRCW